MSICSCPTNCIGTWIFKKASCKSNIKSGSLSNIAADSAGLIEPLYAEEKKMFLKPLEQTQQVIVGNVVEVNSVLAVDDSTDDPDVKNVSESTTPMVVTENTLNTDPINVKTEIYSASGELLNPDKPIGQPELTFMGTVEPVEEADTTETDDEPIASDVEEDLSAQLEE